MNVLISSNWQSVYKNITIPSGLYSRFEKGIHPYIRKTIIFYLQWLREEYHFPIRLNVYCKRGRKIRCRDKDMAYGVIYLPFDRGQLPSIRLACGQYQYDSDITEEMAEETDLILFSLTHEIIHYFQYINNIQLTQRGIERQATVYARSIVRNYIKLCDS